METKKITVEVSERYAALARTQKHLTEAMVEIISAQAQRGRDFYSGIISDINDALLGVAIEMVEESPKELIG